MAPLNQPWKEYLAKKAALEQVTVDAGTTQKIVDDKEENGMCPGSDACGIAPHPLGSTLSCAFRSHMACEVVQQGSTGTSG